MGPREQVNERKMRVRIDAERCQGHALCAMLAPDIFTIHDDDPVASVVENEVGPEDEEAARLGMDSCPERAILLEN